MAAGIVLAGAGFLAYRKKTLGSRAPDWSTEGAALLERAHDDASQAPNWRWRLSTFSQREMSSAERARGARRGVSRPLPAAATPRGRPMRPTPASSAAGRAAENARRARSGKSTPRGHRVHEVVDEVDAFEGRRQGVGVERIGLHHLHSRPLPRIERLPAAPRGPHGVSLPRQPGHQVAPHVPEAPRVRTVDTDASLRRCCSRALCSGNGVAARSYWLPVYPVPLTPAFRGRLFLSQGGWVSRWKQ